MSRRLSPALRKPHAAHSALLVDLLQQDLAPADPADRLQALLDRPPVDPAVAARK